MEKASFTDASDREWHPVVTVRVVREFEKASGIGLFEAVFDTFVTNAGQLKKGAEMPETSYKEVFQVAQKLFGRMEGLAVLLYEGCRNGEGDVVDAFKHPVTFDNFCDAIQPEQVSDALTCAVASLFDFFPSMTDLGGKEGDGKKENPTKRGPGDGRKPTS